MAIQVQVAGGNNIPRVALQAWLDSNGFEVIEENPDVILLDLDGASINAIICTNVKVLVLTSSEDELTLQESLEAGAAGYILKRAVESELIDAIYAVCRGDLYIHSAMTRALLQPPSSKESPVDQPTPREVDVLRYIAQGYTNRQTAEALHISVRTVESHRANLMDKLHLRSRVELVRYAKENGFID
jgi:DNA-binding NarL/FixJ family response regulator